MQENECQLINILAKINNKLFTTYTVKHNIQSKNVW